MSLAFRELVKPSGRFLPLLIAASFALACSSTSTIPVGELAGMKQVERDQPGVLRTADGDTVRLDANSRVRFRRTDGSYTPWRSVHDLSVSDDGVVMVREGRVVDGVRWNDVDAAEVENFEGGQTLVAVVGVSAVVIGIVAIAVLADKNHTATASAPPAHPVPLPHPHPVVIVPVVVVDGPAPPPFYAPTEPDGETMWKRGLQPPSADNARPLFGGAARRRSVVGVVAAIEGGRDFSSAGNGQAAAAGTLRFYDFVELGFGMRYLASDVGSTSVIPFARLGMHGVLDGNRRFALAVGTDFGGGGAVALHFKLNWGLRIRLVDDVWLGIQPFNPTYASYRNDGRSNKVWSFPSGLELGVAF